MPIVHVNGFKISERTIYGTMDNKEIVALFTGYGYQCRIVEDLDHIDEDLAAELDLALGDDDEGGDGDDEDDDEDESDEDDEDDDDDEAVQAKKLLNEEIRDLEAAVAKKNHEIASSANPLIRVSFSAVRIFVLKLIFTLFSASL